MERQHITLSIDSNLSDVPLVGASAKSLCDYISMSPAEAYRVQLSVVEAVTNVIKHAYNSQSGHTVDIAFSLYPDRLIIIITDTGETMQMPPVPELNFDPNDVETLPEKGMGLFIIHRIMDSVSYNRSADKNIQTFTKLLDNNTPS